MFFINSALLGAGLAMDAFSACLVNGMKESNMKKSKMLGISSLFALFQALMPMIGWLCVHTIVQHFKAFEKFIPYIALVLLCFIGGKMLYDAIKNKGENEGEDCSKIGFIALLIQGVATSIDALSVGFTIAEYQFIMALVSVLIIGLVTFGICLLGVFLGKKFGTKLKNKASILGGIILILIGIEIFITGVFF